MNDGFVNTSNAISESCRCSRLAGRTKSKRKNYRYQDSNAGLWLL